MVIDLEKRLPQEPQTLSLEGITVIEAVSGPDLDRWLDVVNEVFAPLAGRPRPWSLTDMARELAARPGCPPPVAWLAQETGQPVGPAVAAVALKPWGPDPLEKAAIGWLAVRPPWRRQGVGRLLVAILERAAWQAGQRWVVAETRSDWSEAIAFYERLGYRPARKQEPHC